MKNSLLNMYSKCGSMNDARSIFDNIQSKDVISWNTMISGYRQNGNGKESIELFQQMQKQGIQPDCFTYTVALSTCSDLSALSIGKEIHSKSSQSRIERTI